MRVFFFTFVTMLFVQAEMGAGNLAEAVCVELN